MSAAFLLAALLAAVVAIASLRLLLRARGGRERAWRTVLLIVGQAASAALLYFTLLPPSETTAPGALVVLTANAPRTAAPSDADIVVALPEARSAPGAERDAFALWLRTNEAQVEDPLALVAALDALAADPACSDCRIELRRRLWPLLATPAASAAQRAAPDARGAAYLDALARERSP